MADYLKLFMDKRLSPSEPHHLEYIKGRLASLKVEDPSSYEDYSQHYGFSVDVTVSEPKKVVVEDDKPKKVSKKK